jgi:hypothetical protein
MLMVKIQANYLNKEIAHAREYPVLPGAARRCRMLSTQGDFSQSYMRMFDHP